MRNVLFVCLVCLYVPSVVSAQVRINELAWMGTAASPNDEWIELSNDGDAAVSLTGWTLIAADGTPSISLSGSISGNGYVLLERTDDTTVPEISADIIFTGAIGNEGEILTLKNSDGALIDTIAASGRWPGGDSATRHTMQWSGSSWTTAPGTPRAENAHESNTPSPEEDGGSDEDEDQEESSSGQNPVPRVRADKVVAIQPDPIYRATMTVPSVIVRGVPDIYRAEAKKDNRMTVLAGKYVWNMGDGTEYTFSKNTPVTYAYEYPGTYTIVFSYYSNRFKEEPDSVHYKKITVLSDSLVLSDASHGGFVIENRTDKDIDLSGWGLRREGGTRLFSK